MRRFDPRRILVRMIIGRNLKAGISYFKALGDLAEEAGDSQTARFAFGSYCQLMYLYEWAYRGRTMKSTLSGGWRTKKAIATADYEENRRRSADMEVAVAAAEAARKERRRIEFGGRLEPEDMVN